MLQTAFRVGRGSASIRCSLLLLAARGAGAQTPPSPFHEIMIGGEIGVPGTSQLNGTCDPTTDSEFHFFATGSTFGPYPGTFVEKGTFTIGPAMPQPNGNVLEFVTDFTARFTIDSRDTVV